MLTARDTNANQVRAAGIAAFFLGIGAAGAPLDPLGMLIGALVLAVLVVALERHAKPLQTFIAGFFGVILCSMIQHAALGQLIGHPLAPSARTVATQFYFGIYPGVIVVALGLGLLSASSMGHKRAPQVIAIIGTIVGIALFFLL